MREMICLFISENDIAIVLRSYIVQPSLPLISFLYYLRVFRSPSNKVSDTQLTVKVCHPLVFLNKCIIIALLKILTRINGLHTTSY